MSAGIADQAVCGLCKQTGGEIIYRSAKLRVVLIGDANYPGYCRVIWNAHVKEMTDLTAADRTIFMNAIWQVEAAVREVMQPCKINLATLGNMVPHLHWHVIPRYVDDAHFPNPIWADRKRMPKPDSLAARDALMPALRTAIVRYMELE